MEINDSGPAEPVVFMEFCSGSSTLSAAMQKQGWRVFPIDYHGNRFKSKAQVFELDLSLDNSITLLEDMIATMRPKGAHFGLMCGACSRARDRPVASNLRSQGRRIQCFFVMQIT